MEPRLSDGPVGTIQEVPRSSWAPVYPGSRVYREILEDRPDETCQVYQGIARVLGNFIYRLIMSPPMKWGDILFLAPLSVCPSVRLSVTLSCPLYIF